MSSLQRDNRIKGLIRCESCTESFALRGQLNRHRKTHTKPYRCDHCTAGFALRSDLNRHKAKHGGRADTKFYCAWPGCHFKGTWRRDNLLKHLRKPHGGKNVTEQVRAAYEKGLEEQKKATDRLSFMKAVQSGHIPTVRQLLLFGADIAVRNDTGKTSLHVATLNGDVEMIQELLGKGIDIEAKDDDNMAALYYAARTGNEATLRILVRHGAGASIIERTASGTRCRRGYTGQGPNDCTIPGC
ncbi:ankyrin [Hyaloscypha bicolor E]|uniref:Ankyrin n=1 Tax=Hyaloscypha bicolor E TaxID=1095630 RepID=A0A2J6T670_9HELO|nr:ankyrin [Hyaloscypha bicolor E]PMD58520.1 ankyrin [Hyaloscypha bicolor E]